MRSLYLIVLNGILFLSLAACSAPPTAETGQLLHRTTAQSTQPALTSVPKKTIGLIMKTLTNPFFVIMEKGARRAEAELGVNLIVQTGAKETSIDQQIAIVKDMVQSKVDAIVIAPGSSTELIPVLKEAQDAGIPIINIDNRLDAALSQQMGLVGVPFISVNNEQGAYLSAKVLSTKITSPTEVAILEGIRSAQNAEDRKKGAMRAFAENQNIKSVTMETANWKIDEAHDVTGKIFASSPQIQAVFCANDMMALGTLKYLDETGRKDVIVASFDALDEAKDEIRSGKLLATVDQQADVQGYLGVQYAVRALHGEKLPAETLVDVKLVTADTLK